MRTKNRIRGTAKKPRIAVFRSNKWLFVQVIDDMKGSTILGKHDKHLVGTEKNKIKRAVLLGKQIAKELSQKKYKEVVFDRSGYTYHGRVAGVAAGLREGGIKV